MVTAVADHIKEYRDEALGGRAADPVVGGQLGQPGSVEEQRSNSTACR
jgi:hypothetical protein